MINQFCHIEIFSQDTAQSAAFYGPLFGWKTTPIMPEYLLYDGAGGIGGGFSTFLQDDNRHCLYIHVDDIDAKLKEIEAAGGAIVKEKSKISDEHGYMALFKDPHGNTLGLWSQN